MSDHLQSVSGPSALAPDLTPSDQAPTETDSTIDFNDLPALCLSEILSRLNPKGRRCLNYAASSVYRLCCTPEEKGRLQMQVKIRPVHLLADSSSMEGNSQEGKAESAFKSESEMREALAPLLRLLRKRHGQYRLISIEPLTSLDLKSPLAPFAYGTFLPALVEALQGYSGRVFCGLLDPLVWAVTGTTPAASQAPEPLSTAPVSASVGDLGTDSVHVTRWANMPWLREGLAALCALTSLGQGPHEVELLVPPADASSFSHSAVNDMLRMLLADSFDRPLHNCKCLSLWLPEGPLNVAFLGALSRVPIRHLELRIAKGPPSSLSGFPDRMPVSGLEKLTITVQGTRPKLTVREKFNPAPAPPTHIYWSYDRYFDDEFFEKFEPFHEELAAIASLLEPFSKEACCPNLLDLELKLDLTLRDGLRYERPDQLHLSLDPLRIPERFPHLAHLSMEIELNNGGWLLGVPEMKQLQLGGDFRALSRLDRLELQVDLLALLFNDNPSHLDESPADYNYNFPPGEPLRNHVRLPPRLEPSVQVKQRLCSRRVVNHHFLNEDEECGGFDWFFPATFWLTSTV